MNFIRKLRPASFTNEHIDLYEKGEGIPIIDQFNALKLNPFIE